MHRNQKLIISLFLTCGFSIATPAFDGVAVVTSSRYSNNYNQTPEVSLGRELYVGKIRRIRIENSAIASSDTIYKATWARKPRLNINGDVVAFFRFSAKNQNGSLVDDNKPIYLSTMNTDGGNVQDLVEFNPDTKLGQIDWSGLGWIFYTVEKGGRDDATTEVWKVKADDKTTNQLVFSYAGDWWKWTISANEAKALGVIGVGSDGGNTPHLFPPSTTPSAAGFYDKCRRGCMGVIAPGGNIYMHALRGLHKEQIFHTWSPPTDCDTAGYEVSMEKKNSQIWDWVSVPSHTRDDAHVMHGNYFSANSDKWFVTSHATWRQSYKCGANFTVVNWVDGQGLYLSSNENHPWPDARDYSNTIVYCDSDGDFRLDGPAGSFQDTTGAWFTPEGTQVRVGRSRIRQRGISIGRHTPRSFDIRGRAIPDAAKRNYTGVRVIRSENAKTVVGFGKRNQGDRN